METIQNIFQAEIIQRLGWTLVHFVWQAAAIGLTLAIVLKLLHKSSANLRYIIASMALALIVLIPAVTIRMIDVSVEAVEPVKLKQAGFDLPKAEADAQAVIEMPQIESPSAQVAATPRISLRDKFIKTIEPTLPYVVVIWLVGVFGLSLWHLGGWTQLQRLRRQMVKQVTPTLKAKLQQLSNMLGIQKTIGLVESALVQVPTVVGHLKPVILLPASALTGLSSEQIEAILAHELAHIKRCDYLVNILQTVVEILGFYHPAVWWVSHKIRVERENCCDDIAVSLCSDRVCYAKALTTMEEIRAGQPALAVAASGGSLFDRILRLLGKNSTEKERVGWIPSVIAILLITALVIPTTLALTARKADKPAVQVKTPTVAKSPALITEDKTQIRVNCTVLEAYKDLKMDRETTVMAKNILSKKTGLGDFSSYSTTTELLKTVVDNSEAGGLEALMDLLVSRGYLNILANPSIEVFDGQRAKITARSDANKSVESDSVRVTSIDVTPEVLEDGDIRLKAKVTLSSTIPPKKKGAEPIVTTREIATNMRIGPGKSQIIGGITTKEKRGIVRKGTKDVEERTKEVLVILTPITITPEMNLNKKPAVQVKGKKLPEGLEIKEVFLPDVEKSPMALDLATGKLIEIQCKGEIDFDNPDFIQALKKLKKGNLIYENHGFVCLQGTNMIGTPHFENDIPFPWYEIPKYLPFATIVTTVEGHKYNLNVLEATGKGCLLVYSPISIDAEVRPEILIAQLRVEKLQKRVESANKLSELGKAILIFASDHDEKYPDSLEEAKSYLRNEQDFQWFIENVEYPGKGKRVTISPQAVIAYDKTLLEQEDSHGTNVLYNDAHVAFEKIERLEKLGIKSQREPAVHEGEVNEAQRRIDAVKWSEGKEFTQSIAMGIRAWRAKNNPDGSWDSNQITFADLGFIPGDLTGTYFDESNFSWVITCNKDTGELLYTIRTTAGKGITAPDAMSLDESGNWREETSQPSERPDVQIDAEMENRFGLMKSKAPEISITVFPIIMSEKPYKNVAEVVALMLERADVNNIDVPDETFSPAKDSDIRQICKSFEAFVREKSIDTDYALFGEYVGTPQSGVKEVRCIVVDKAGNRVWVDRQTPGDDDFKRIKPNNPMLCSHLLVERLRMDLGLPEQSGRNSATGKWAKHWRKDSGIPPASERAEMANRLESMRENFRDSKLVIFPTLVNGKPSEESADRLRKMLSDRKLCLAGKVSDEVLFEIEPTSNEQKMLWDLARKFRKYIRDNEFEADYMLYGDYLLNAATGVGSVHFVICDGNGEWVIVDFQNEYQSDFKSISPKTSSDCDRLIVKRLRSYLDGTIP